MRLKLFTPWLHDGSVIINIQDYGYNATDWHLMEEEDRFAVAAEIVLQLMEFEYEVI